MPYSLSIAAGPTIVAATNIASISSEGVVTFVSGSYRSSGLVKAGDNLVIAGTVSNNGTFAVEAVCNETQIKIAGPKIAEVGVGNGTVQQANGTLTITDEPLPTWAAIAALYPERVYRYQVGGLYPISGPVRPSQPVFNVYIHSFVAINFVNNTVTTDFRSLNEFVAASFNGSTTQRCVLQGSASSLIFNAVTLTLGEEPTPGYTRALSVWGNHILNTASRIITRIFGSVWKIVAGTPRIGVGGSRVINSILNTEGGNAFVIADAATGSTAQISRTNLQDSRVVQQSAIANSNDIAGFCAANSSAVVTGSVGIVFKNLTLDPNQLAPITAGFLFTTIGATLTFVNHSPFTLTQLLNFPTGSSGVKDSTLRFEFRPRFVSRNELTGVLTPIAGANITLRPFGSTRGTIDPVLTYTTDANGQINGGTPIELITEDTLQRGGFQNFGPFTLNVNRWLLEVVYSGGKASNSFEIRKLFDGDILVQNGTLNAGGLLD